MLQLKELIEELEKMPSDGIIPFGFGEPMSFRGYYDELAFEPVENAKVSDMLNYAREAMGSTFTGYKGGDFEMGEGTNCWIASYGSADADGIGMTLINMWRYTLGMNKEDGIA